MNSKSYPFSSYQIEVDTKLQKKNLYTILDQVRKKMKISYIQVVPTIYIDPFNNQIIQNLVVYVPNSIFINKQRQFRPYSEVTIFKSNTLLSNREIANSVPELHYIADALLKAYPDHSFSLELLQTKIFKFDKPKDLNQYIKI